MFVCDVCVSSEKHEQQTINSTFSACEHQNRNGVTLSCENASESECLITARFCVSLSSHRCSSCDEPLVVSVVVVENANATVP